MKTGRRAAPVEARALDQAGETIIRRFAPCLIFHPGKCFPYTIGESRES